MCLQMMSTFGMDKNEKMNLVNTPTMAIRDKGKNKVEDDDRKIKTAVDSDDDFVNSQGYTPIIGYTPHNEDMKINL